MRPIKTFLNDPREITQGLVRKFLSSRIEDDRTYLSYLYAATFWKKMHWENPQTFNEKMTWLKVYGRDPKYTTMVDKYSAKSLVSNLIGGGIWLIITLLRTVGTRLTGHRCLTSSSSSVPTTAAVPSFAETRRVLTSRAHGKS